MNVETQEIVLLPSPFAHEPIEFSLDYGAGLEIPIERQLLTFISDQIKEFDPDIIVVVERKGTAILRALKESDRFQLVWPWQKVISSESIEQTNSDFFDGKKILIFDDSMKTASHLKGVLSDLSKRVSLTEDIVRVAVFAVHEESGAAIDYGGGVIKYSWFYHCLTPESYRAIQIKIIRMLQRAGSLMLDTEHIEVRLRLRSNFLRLIEALRRKSEAYIFHSADWRTNITVFYEDNPAHSFDSALFPKGTCFSGIVRKARIVDRGNNEFAIIPICFPSIPDTLDGWEINEADSELFGSGIHASSTARFNAVGLLAAMDVLRWVLKDLAVINHDDFLIELPKGLDDTGATSGYTLEHLHVVFPSLNIDSLTGRIKRIYADATAEASPLRVRKFDAPINENPSDRELQSEALRLLQKVRYMLDQKILEERNVDDKTAEFPCEGLTLAEVYSIGETLGIEKSKISILCDILIDQAALSTGIMSTSERSNPPYKIRVFAPSGEIISEYLRRYTSYWGLP